MKDHHFIPPIFWIGLSLLVIVLSYKLGLGGLHAPGPGLMPFLLGALLLLISVYLLVSLLLKRSNPDQTDDTGHRAKYARIALVMGSLFFFALLLETLGYVIVSSLFFIILFRSMGNKWSMVMLASALTVSVTYFGFTFLGVKFPTGLLSF